jgi:hypothetical protein
MIKELLILKAYIQGYAIGDIKNLFTPIEHEVLVPQGNGEKPQISYKLTIEDDFARTEKTTRFPEE